MRVAHYIQRYPPALGGSEAYFSRLSRYLTEAGDHVTVFTTTALDLQAFWRPGGRCLPPGVTHEEGGEIRRYAPTLRFRGRRFFLKPLSLFPHRTWQALTLPCNPISCKMWADAGRATARFDIVHAAAFPYAWPIACARRLARTLGVPFVLTPFLHLGDPEDPKESTRRAYTQPALLELARSADRLLVQTEGEQEELLRQGISAERIILQGMGVDLDDCTGGDRDRARRAWGVGPGEVVVGHLANNSREKGTVDLLLAAERAWQRGASFRLILAGPEMPNFLHFWQNYRHADRVCRLGPLDAQQKRDFFVGIDGFALPSRSDSFGIVLLEAWANGVPNIAYRAGGIAWVIRPGEDGLLVRCGDVDELAGALTRLTADAGLRRALGRVGQKRTRQHLWPAKLQLVRDLYQELSRPAFFSPISFASKSGIS
jgi:glycosyltransferase involved in cell wall biosynthesis